MSYCHDLVLGAGTGTGAFGTTGAFGQQPGQQQQQTGTGLFGQAQQPQQQAGTTGVFGGFGEHAHFSTSSTFRNHHALRNTK